MKTKPSKIAFTQFNIPALDSGEYRIRINQTVTVDGQTELTPSVEKEFYVAGERFHLTPEYIHSVFPPARSLGDYADAFPHIMLLRNTLPWEREAISNDPDNTPWLALLVIHEEEEADATVDTVTINDIKTPSTTSPWFPGIGDLEPGQSDDLRVAVLDVKKSLLEQILPDPDTLRFMTHLRQGKDDAANPVGEDVTTLIANRLPKRGVNTTVHLVSVESRYKTDGTFDYQGAGDDDMIRLVKLHSWSFTATRHFKLSPAAMERSTVPTEIKDKLKAIEGREFFTDDDFTAALKEEAGLTDSELAGHEAIIFKQFTFGDFATILKQLDRSTATLRLPDTNIAATDKYLQTGFYPLPHKLRQGARTVSWYHGPLSPQSNNREAIAFPADGADALLRYYKTNGMFDVSYAAAWKLGRLLGLQDGEFSTELYLWKRRFAKVSHQQTQLVGYLQGGNRDHTPEPLTESLKTWLMDLVRLKGVPFNYLVPDEELLPAESIRFFQLDDLWVESLLDGALSIGRVTSGDLALDHQIRSSIGTLTSSNISGFILRSEAVSGWPGMLIGGYNTVPKAGEEERTMPDAAEINIIRREQLSQNVLLCLFDGDLKTLDLHLKPEMLHFGVNIKSGGGYEKELRGEDGVENGAHTVDVPVDTTNFVLDMGGLVSNITDKYDALTDKTKICWDAPPTSVSLALQLLEGTDRVRFIEAPST